VIEGKRLSTTNLTRTSGIYLSLTTTRTVAEGPLQFEKGSSLILDKVVIYYYRFDPSLSFLFLTVFLFLPTSIRYMRRNLPSGHVLYHADHVEVEGAIGVPKLVFWPIVLE